MYHKHQPYIKERALSIFTFGKLSIILCFAVLSIASFGASSASAISVYDDALATVDNLKYGPINNYQDVTSTYTSLFSDCNPSYLTSFQTALSSGNWLVKQQIGAYLLSPGVYQSTYEVEITWSESDNTAEVFFSEPDINFPYGRIGLVDSYPPKTLTATFNWWSGQPQIQCWNGGNYLMSKPVDVDATSAPGGYHSAIFSNTFPVNYPEDYEGGLVPTIDFDADDDEDGVTLIQEMQQGTFDNNKDTDGDGISDLKESIWYEDRDDVFCDTTTPPYTCAYPDPTSKDLYVEMDWMYDPIEDRPFKPKGIQLEKIEDAFDAKGIKFHADTGQFGGGNELQSYENFLYMGDSPTTADFTDFKLGYDSHPANFNTDREGVWHYMISGYGFAEDPTSSGIAEVGGSESFISSGLIEDTFTYADLDEALAGTMIHEIGHNLCLSDALVYVDQPSGCAHGGVDSDSVAYVLYDSAMNYRYQFETIDYSDGSHGLNDHDDWSAVKLGISEFTKVHTPLSAPGKSSERKQLAFDMNLAAPNKMTPEQSKQIYEEKQKESTPTNGTDTTPTPSTQPTTDTTDSGFDTKTSVSEKLTAEQSKQIQQSHQIIAWLAPILATAAALGLVVTVFLIVRKKKNRK